MAEIFMKQICIRRPGHRPGQNLNWLVLSLISSYDSSVLNVIICWLQTQYFAFSSSYEPATDLKFYRILAQVKSGRAAPAQSCLLTWCTHRSFLRQTPDQWESSTVWDMGSGPIRGECCRLTAVSGQGGQTGVMGDRGGSLVRPTQPRTQHWSDRRVFWIL